MTEMDFILAAAIIIIAAAVGVVSHIAYKLAKIIYDQAKDIDAVKMHINNFYRRLNKLESKGKSPEPTNLMFKNVREKQKKD